MNELNWSHWRNKTKCEQKKNPKTNWVLIKIMFHHHHHLSSQAPYMRTAPSSLLPRSFPPKKKNKKTKFRWLMIQLLSFCSFFLFSFNFLISIFFLFHVHCLEIISFHSIPFIHSQSMWQTTTTTTTTTPTNSFHVPCSFSLI